MSKYAIFQILMVKLYIMKYIQTLITNFASKTIQTVCCYQSSEAEKFGERFKVFAIEISEFFNRIEELVTRSTEEQLTVLTNKKLVVCSFDDIPCILKCILHQNAMYNIP